MDKDMMDIIRASRESKPSDFQSYTNDLLGQRIVAALERRRQELAQSAFSSSHDTESAEAEADFDTDEVEDEVNSDTDSNEVVDTQIEEPNGQDA